MTAMYGQTADELIRLEILLRSNSARTALLYPVWVVGMATRLCDENEVVVVCFGATNVVDGKLAQIRNAGIVLKSVSALKWKGCVDAWREIYELARARGEGTESKKRSAWLEGGGKKDRTGE